jgi:hypothetical protein
MVVSTNGLGVIDCVPGSGNCADDAVELTNANTNNPNQIDLVFART